MATKIVRKPIKTGGHKMDVRKTRAWKAAEMDYCGIQADLRMVAWGSPPTAEEVVDRLKLIARRYAQYYPAVMELGIRLLARKGDRAAVRMIEKGFGLMIELAEPKNFAEEMDSVIDNLEKFWRFDVSRRLLENLAECRGLSATLHDSLAHAASRLGDMKTAQSHVEAAIRLEPKNKGFWSNKGLYHLMAGELEEAGMALLQARQLAPKDPTIIGNLEIHKYLGKHGGNYFDYLLRPLDRKRLARLADQEKWEQWDSLRAGYNDCRMDAFAQSIILESEERRSRLPHNLTTLRIFFGFVEQVDPGGAFLNEDMDLVHRNFKPIMHKFIFKFGDVDREMLEDVFEALMAYYGFLASRGTVDATDFKDFEKTIGDMQGELIGKMKRYNAIRHDRTVKEKQKEAIREELFQGDHAWPHL